MRVPGRGQGTRQQTRPTDQASQEARPDALRSGCAWVWLVVVLRLTLPKLAGVCGT